MYFADYIAMNFPQWVQALIAMAIASGVMAMGYVVGAMMCAWVLKTNSTWGQVFDKANWYANPIVLVITICSTIAAALAWVWAFVKDMASYDWGGVERRIEEHGARYEREMQATWQANKIAKDIERKRRRRAMPPPPMQVFENEPQTAEQALEWYKKKYPLGNWENVSLDAVTWRGRKLPRETDVKQFKQEYMGMPLVVDMDLAEGEPGVRRIIMIPTRHLGMAERDEFLFWYGLDGNPHTNG